MKWPTLIIQQDQRESRVPLNEAPLWAVRRCIKPDFDKSDDGLTPQRSAIAARILQERGT